MSRHREELMKGMCRPDARDVEAVTMSVHQTSKGEIREGFCPDTRRSKYQVVGEPQALTESGRRAPSLRKNLHPLIETWTFKLLYSRSTSVPPATSDVN
jgi:hypothetical protein